MPFCITNDISYFRDLSARCIMNVFAIRSSKFSNALGKRSSVAAEDRPPAGGIQSLQVLQQQQVPNAALAAHQHNMWDHARSR